MGSQRGDGMQDSESQNWQEQIEDGQALKVIGISFQGTTEAYAVLSAAQPLTKAKSA